MPQPHTGELVPSGKQLWTFDSAGNLIITGGFYTGGIPDPTQPGPGQPLVPGTPVVNSSTISGLAPSGDTSGATDLANIQAILNLGGAVSLRAGTTYWVDNDIMLPAGATMVGGGGWDQQNFPGVGTVIKCAAGYSAGGVAVLNQYNASETAQAGAYLRDFAVDCSLLTTQVIDGYRGTGAVQAGVMMNLRFYKATGVGINNVTLAGDIPFAFHIFNVKVNTTGSYGISLGTCTDVTMIDVQTIGSGSHGFYIAGAMPNSRLIGCRAEWAAKGTGCDGYHLTGSWSSVTGSGGFVMSGCSSDRNDGNGFYCDATGKVPVLVTGCAFRRDGRNNDLGGGGYAGIQLNGSTLPIFFDNYTVFPGVDDGGGGLNSPQYGISVMGTSTRHARFGLGYAQGDTQGLYTPGTTMTDVWFNPEMICASGPTNAPVIGGAPALAIGNTGLVDIVNTTTETTIISLTLPSGCLSAGATFRVNLTGSVQTQATSGTLTFKTYLGGVAAAQTAVMGNQAGASGPSGFNLELYIQVRSTGTGGVFVVSGKGRIDFGTQVNLDIGNLAANTIDTTQANPVISVTATWATMSATNELKVAMATIEKVTQP